MCVARDRGTTVVRSVQKSWQSWQTRTFRFFASPPSAIVLTLDFLLKRHSTSFEKQRHHLLRLDWAYMFPSWWCHTAPFWPQGEFPYILDGAIKKLGSFISPQAQRNPTPRFCLVRIPFLARNPLRSWPTTFSSSSCPAWRTGRAPSSPPKAKRREGRGAFFGRGPERGCRGCYVAIVPVTTDLLLFGGVANCLWFLPSSSCHFFAS